MLAAAASASTTRAGSPCNNSLPEQLIATGTLMPRSSHLRICRQTARTTQLLMSRIKPLSSAISTKRVGEMSPYSASRQRSSASTPTSLLSLSRNFGWNTRFSKSL
jgi:hypothetical protein